MTRKRAKAAFVRKLDDNVPRNPLLQPPGSVWTQQGENGEIQMWGAHTDTSMTGQGLGSFHSAGVFVYLWEVPRADRGGTNILVTNPWNGRPLRIYAKMERAVAEETLRWKTSKGIL